MLRLFFLLIASVSLLTSCDKDEDGMYLSPNYCTATINGEEYAYQEHYAIPMMWGSWPDADYQTLYAPSFWSENAVTTHKYATITSGQY